MNPGGLLRVLGLNAVPVGGVMLAGWSTGTGLALYWCETLLGTATNAVRIALHRRMTGKRGHYRGQLGVEINAGDDPPARRPARGRTQWRSFLTEYLVGSLVFTFAHGLFLAIILGAFIKSWPAKGDLLYGLAGIALFQAGGLAFDLTSLRVLFTGGEMVPYQRASEFEDRTGCAVLQFYGSNETGALSNTCLDDSRERRLRTAGRVIEEMRVRLFDDEGTDVTAAGGPGIAACKGRVNCLGYYGDAEANARLYTADGWMLTGDYCTIDTDGYLTVGGRASDFIIRGGKNISAAQVEDEVSSHTAVALAAAVAMPDPVFGERVCVYLELQPGAEPLDLDAVRAHLDGRGVGKELWPERVIVVDALPRSSGGKVAKGDLRDDIRARIAAEEPAS